MLANVDVGILAVNEEIGIEEFAVDRDVLDHLAALAQLCTDLCKDNASRLRRDHLLGFGFSHRRSTFLI